MPSGLVRPPACQRRARTRSSELSVCRCRPCRAVLRGPPSPAKALPGLWLGGAAGRLRRPRGGPTRADPSLHFIPHPWALLLWPMPHSREKERLCFDQMTRICRRPSAEGARVPGARLLPPCFGARSRRNAIASTSRSALGVRSGVGPCQWWYPGLPRAFPNRSQLASDCVFVPHPRDIAVFSHSEAPTQDRTQKGARAEVPHPLVPRSTAGGINGQPALPRDFCRLGASSLVDKERLQRRG